MEQTPPLYDKDLNVITPAGQRISFNASLVDRDGILDSCYARTLGLSVRRARLVVDSDVTVIRHQLYQSGSLTIGSNLGTLTLQESGELLFTPVQERQGLLRALPSELLASSRRTSRSYRYGACQ